MRKNTRGRIFDIRRFSIHDGEGIRTTVFFKGCPLKCKWCHNPEGLGKDKMLIYFENKCIKCGQCLKVNENGFVEQKEDKLVFNRSACENWEPYIEACPTGAISYDAKDYTIDEVMEVVRQDKPFYKYGGGVTLSGGEIFSQVDFAVELLEACKSENIQTAIETSSYAESELFNKVASLADMIFVDFKIFDNLLHKKYTGVSNEKIKENILDILSSPKREQVIVRTPVIPKFTDALGNIEQIAGFISNIYSDVKYELLNYNPLAISKYELYNMDFCYSDKQEKFTDEQMESFYEAAIKGGAQKLIRE